MSRRIGLLMMTSSLNCGGWWLFKHVKILDIYTILEFDVNKLYNMVNKHIEPGEI